jgi:hypothetical protein
MTAEPFAVPAWGNPLPGRFRLNTRDFWLGLLCLDGDTLSYLTADGAKFSAPVAQLTFSWRPGSTLKIPRCDVTARSTLYRLYFERPGDDAPEYDQTAAQRIGERMSSLGVLQNLGGVGDAFLVVRLLGQMIAFPAAVAEHRTAKANFTALRELVEARQRGRRDGS